MNLSKLFLCLGLLVNLTYTQEHPTFADKEGIYPYNPFHKQAVREIAKQHAPVLLQFYHNDKGEEVFNKMFDESILSESEQGKFLVYLKDETPVGFVTYIFRESWLLKSINVMFGTSHKTGHINFIAVDKGQQGKGYGSQLIRHVLGEFNQNNVHKATLRTVKDVGNELAPFYVKFGFAPYRTSKYSDWATCYKKRMAPNPWLGLLKSALRFCKK